MPLPRRVELQPCTSRMLSRTTSVPTDLVAVSDFTFIASANAARIHRCMPVLLVDSERETWNLDGEMLYDIVRDARPLGKPIPTAVEVVHVLGQPAELEPLLALVTSSDDTDRGCR